MKKILPFLVFALSLFAVQGDALAASFGRSAFSGSRSTFSSSRSYSAPTPTPSRPVIVQRNVTTHVTQIHQSAPAVASGGGGGGMLSTFVGSMAGSAVGNWLFGHKEQPAAAAPAQQLVPVDCSAEANRALPVCNQVAK